MKRVKNRLRSGRIIADTSQMPFQSFISGMVQIELLSNCEAVVEGCRSILAYDEMEIKLATEKMKIAFYGRELSLKNLNSESVIIVGIIDRVEFIP